MRVDRARSRVLLPRWPDQIAQVLGAPRQANGAPSHSSDSTPPHALARPMHDGDRALFSELILLAEAIPREKQQRMRKEADKSQPGQHRPAHNSDLWRLLD